MMHARNTRRRRKVPRWLGLLLAAATAPVAGQVVDAPAGIADAFQPDFLRRDIGLIADDLDLDEAQADIVFALYEDYDRSFRAGSDALRAELTGLRPERTDIDRERVRIDAERNQQFADLAATFERKRAELPPGADDSDLRRQLQEEAEAIRENSKQIPPKALPREQQELVWTHSTEAVERWNAERTRLREQFVANLQAVLMEDQLARWPSTERMLRRRKALPRGQLSGESVDLIQLVRELRADEDLAADLAPVLLEYEIDLDATLRERDDFLRRSEKQIMRAKMEEDLDAAAALIDRQVEHRQRVRDVNIGGVTSIVAVLPEDVGEEFEAAASRKMFQRVYRRTQAARLLEQALALEGLDPDLVPVIEDLQMAYEAELGPQRDRLLQEILRYEPAQLRQRSRISLGEKAGGLIGNDPIQAQFRQRRAVDESFIRQLQAVLPAEQFDRLRSGRTRNRALVPTQAGPGANRPPR